MMCRGTRSAVTERAQCVTRPDLATESKIDAMPVMLALAEPARLDIHLASLDLAP